MKELAIFGYALVVGLLVALVAARKWEPWTFAAAVALTLAAPFVFRNWL